MKTNLTYLLFNLQTNIKNICEPNAKKYFTSMKKCDNTQIFQHSRSPIYFRMIFILTKPYHTYWSQRCKL